MYLDEVEGMSKIMRSEYTVTIVVTVYNYEYTKEFESVLCSLSRQKIDKEIVLCEQSTEVSDVLLKLCEKYSIKYINIQPEIIGGECFYNIGRVRNVAALCSKSKYIYFTDADILIYDVYYLHKLISYSEKHMRVSCMRPKMRRLKKEFHPMFSRDYLAGVNIDFNTCSPYCYSEYSEEKNKISPISCGELYRVMYNLVHVGEVNKSEKNIVFIAKNIEEFSNNWKTAIHFGGILCNRETFIEVGGYCEKYYNWGAEDVDFQWKVMENSGMQLIDYIINDCAILHFEHDSRCDNILYERNRGVCDKRRESSVDKIIASDLQEESFFAKWHAKDYEFCKKEIKYGREHLVEYQ